MGRGEGRGVASAGPGERARGVRQDVAPLVQAASVVRAGSGAGKR
jgi:hypothetical protein